MATIIICSGSNETEGIHSTANVFCRLGGCSIITKKLTILARRWKVYSEKGNQDEWQYQMNCRTRLPSLHEKPPNKMCKVILCTLKNPSSHQDLNIAPFFAIPWLYVAGRQVKRNIVLTIKPII